ncbi:MAG: ABC transporter permease subunit, partial [Atribacterota bacterium]|nr:ABC transporter permease subunit [Atribacterota bacterium]
MEGLSAVLESLPYILSGIPVTLGLVALSLALGFTLGVPMAVATVYGNRVMAKIIQVFVFVMRGLPNLVLLFLFYFGIFPLLGWNLSPFVIGVITLGLRSAARS